MAWYGASPLLLIHACGAVRNLIHHPNLAAMASNELSGRRGREGVEVTLCTPVKAMCSHEESESVSPSLGKAVEEVESMGQHLFSNVL